MTHRCQFENGNYFCWCQHQLKMITQWCSGGRTQGIAVPLKNIHGERLTATENVKLDNYSMDAIRGFVLGLVTTPFILREVVIGNSALILS